MLDLENLEHRAWERLSATMYNYFAGGADDETTLADNPLAWQRIRLVPRVLRDAGDVSIATEVLGTPMSMPIMVGPWAFQGLAHPEGEPATAKGSGRRRRRNGGLHRGHLLAGGHGPGGRRVASVVPVLPAARPGLPPTSCTGRPPVNRAVVMTVDKLPIAGRRRRLAADRFSLPEGTPIANFGYVVPEDKDTGPDGYLRGLLDAAHLRRPGVGLRRVPPPGGGQGDPQPPRRRGGGGGGRGLRRGRLQPRGTGSSTGRSLPPTPCPR